MAGTAWPIPLLLAVVAVAAASQCPCRKSKDAVECSFSPPVECFTGKVKTLLVAHPPDNVTSVELPPRDRCSSLDRLTVLGGHQLTEVKNLANCPALKTISVHFASLGSLPGLDGNTKLKNVDLQGNQITSLPTNAFSANPQLEQVQGTLWKGGRLQEPYYQIFRLAQPPDLVVSPRMRPW